jgi:adenylate kinase family enzyme
MPARDNPVINAPADARDTAPVSAGMLWDDLLMERLSARGRDGRRARDRPPPPRGVYHEQTEPLIAHYRVSGRLTRIDGVGSTEEVGARLSRAAPTGTDERP